MNEELDVHDSKVHFDICVIVQCMAMDKLNFLIKQIKKINRVDRCSSEQ